MSHHNHGTAESYGDTKASRRKWHKDWRVWVVVILMLGAMAIFILTLDESVMPRIFGH